MDIAEALLKLAPGAQWSLNSNDYSQLQWFSEDISKPTLEEITAKWTELESAKPLKLLRQTRDKLLQETDWISSKYYDLGQPVPTEWAAYRQALRDLPANTADPANPVWPTKPGGES